MDTFLNQIYQMGEMYIAVYIVQFMKQKNPPAKYKSV